MYHAHKRMTQFILVDRRKDTCDVLRWQFREHPEVQVVCGKFEELPVYDCVITPGNSFGLMDAGMDLAVVRFFGRHVMDQIQKEILSGYLGEQPVGTCVLVPTAHPDHPYVAHAPTMRVPTNIHGTDNVYLSVWAALTSIHRHNRTAARKINTVACPAMGTGTGGMDLMEAAWQIRLAYEHFRKPPASINPSFAQERQERIHFGGRWGFENPRPPQET